jgi:hypothetical protein
VYDGLRIEWARTFETMGRQSRQPDVQQGVYLHEPAAYFYQPFAAEPIRANELNQKVGALQQMGEQALAHERIELQIEERECRREEEFRRARRHMVHCDVGRPDSTVLIQYPYERALHVLLFGRQVSTK